MIGKERIKASLFGRIPGRTKRRGGEQRFTGVCSEDDKN